MVDHRGFSCSNGRRRIAVLVAEEDPLIFLALFKGIRLAAPARIHSHAPNAGLRKGPRARFF